MCINLVLLTSDTTSDILADEGCESWPPEFRGNKLASFEDTRVTGRRMIMVMGDNFTMKVSVSRNIDMTLICQNTCIVMLIREVGAKFGGEFTRKSMKGIQDKWVRGRGGTKLVGEGGVNKIDEEGVREEDYCIVISIRGWYMIRMMG